MKALSHLNKYLLKYKWYLILGAFFTLISNLFGIVPAQLVRYSLDLVRENISTYFLFDGFKLQTGFYNIFAKTVLFYGVLILIMALLKGLFLFLVRQTIIVMSRHIEFDLKNEIYAHYQTLPMAFMRQNSTGDLMARISEDVNKVRMYVGPSLMYGINLVLVFVLVIGYMYSVNPTLTFYVLIPLPILSVSIYFVNQIIIKRSEQIQKQLSNISTFVQEAFSGIRVLKAFVQEEPSAVAFTNQSNIYREKQLNLIKVDSLFSPLIQLLIGISTVLVIYIGGREVIEGRLTPGSITEFIMYVYILTWPVTALGWTTSQIQRAAASQQRINEFLAVKSDIGGDKGIVKVIEGNIVFDNVSFTYPDSGIVALKNFNLAVKPGESFAILGTTGSGKSTIANLLCRMYDVTEGQILIDGINIKDLNVNQLREQIGYVPQDVFLFSDSISNNIRFGKNEMSDETIKKAATDADLIDNVQDFTNGFDTVLGERGITLSGGQKQRLSIARAIARDPKILILDDCLSAVDTKTENAILNNLEKIMHGRTSIIISHRVSSAKLADMILIMDEGKVIEVGTHAQLLGQNGIYKEMFDKQLAGEEL
jgi:ATP-binding cassette, subfamily B, multidrug efflux pump